MDDKKHNYINKLISDLTNKESVFVCISYKSYNHCRCLHVIVNGAFKILCFSTSVATIHLNGP